MTKSNRASASPDYRNCNYLSNKPGHQASKLIEATSSFSSSSCCSTSLHRNFVSSPNNSQQLLNDKQQWQAVYLNSPTYKSTLVPRNNFDRRAIDSPVSREKIISSSLTEKASDTIGHLINDSFAMDDNRLDNCFISGLRMKKQFGVQKLISSPLNFTLLLVTLLVTVSTCLPFTSASLECGERQFKCLDGKKCIPVTWKCDNGKDCEDGSDELGCLPKSCRSDEFHCRNGKCIPEKWTCDDTDDCGDRSDEVICTNRTCGENHFSCKSGQCIPSHWKCDGQRDCSDGSDEDFSSCTASGQQCNQKEFRCKNNRCISKEWVCDRSDDCGDGSDEVNCPIKSCPSGTFTCRDGPCISYELKCNGQNDCRDGSDEVNCPEVHRTHKGHGHSCNSHVDWMCGSKECIHINWLCDGTADCKDGSDEANCSKTCSPDQLQCKLTRDCVPHSARCNGVLDCSDGSDEQDCVSTSATAATINEKVIENVHGWSCESKDSFKCNTSSKCIPMAAVCDGNNDCGDWSDESANCGQNECSTDANHCSQICVDDPIGFHCECLRGYALSADNRTCDDVDECKTVTGICSGHPCVNTKGHFKCECLPGYQVKDHVFCKLIDKDHSSLLFSNRHDLRLISLADDTGSRPAGHYDLLYTGQNASVALDFSWRGNYLVWSDVFDEKIYIAKLNKSLPSPLASDEPRQLISDDLNTVDGIAIDYIHDLVYWTDTGKDTIEVASITTPSWRKVLINSDLEEPRAIVVDTRKARLFWSDWGDRPKIERSLQDGSARTTIVSSDIIWPNGLTFDVVTERIYWIDRKMGIIESSDANGENRVILLNSREHISHPFSIASFGEFVYWSEWETEKIMRAPKYPLTIDGLFSGNSSTFVPRVETVLSDLFSVGVVKAVDPFLQPDSWNLCHSSECSHLCLPIGSSNYKCSCADGFTLSSNGYSCILFNATSTGSASNSEITTIAPTTSSSNTGAWNRGVNSSVHRNQPDEGSSSGHILIVLLAFSLAVSLVFFSLGFIVYRNYKRRNITSMNFDNPVYRKTTEEQFALEKSDHEDNSHMYQSSLEPLNQPGTNDFV